MSKEAANKAVVGRWFTDFWGKNVNLAVVDDPREELGLRRPCRTPVLALESKARARRRRS